MASRGNAESRIVASGEAAVLRQGNGFYPGIVIMEPRRRAILRTVVHNDNLKIPEVLLLQSIKADRKKMFAVPVGDDNRYQGWGQRTTSRRSLMLF